VERGKEEGEMRKKERKVKKEKAEIVLRSVRIFWIDALSRNVDVVRIE